MCYSTHQMVVMTLSSVATHAGADISEYLKMQLHKWYFLLLYFHYLKQFSNLNVFWSYSFNAKSPSRLSPSPPNQLQRLSQNKKNVKSQYNKSSQKQEKNIKHYSKDNKTKQ